jgi:glutathione S-transferase
MFDVYAFATPNSVKVPIALEELGLAYTLHGVNVRKGEQRSDSFIAMNANAKVPVLVDLETEGAPFVLTESAAILVYLAEKTGELLGEGPQDRARIFEQLFFHASALGPAFGQSGFFQRQVLTSRARHSPSPTLRTSAGSGAANLLASTSQNPPMSHVGTKRSPVDRPSFARSSASMRFYPRSKHRRPMTWLHGFICSTAGRSLCPEHS